MLLVNQLPKVGDIIKDRYQLIQDISLEEKKMIFLALDQQMRQIVIKMENDSDEHAFICIESAILQVLTNSNHIPQFLSYGQHKNYKFMAYELLGPNMIDLVNYKKPFKFSLHSILKFGIQAIETLKIIHNQDFIHRDIKPGNFLIGNTQETFGTFYLIGFELCKKINRHCGVVATPTNKGKFRGAMIYTSLNAHNLVELGRNDDLISLLYILVEYYNGMLPWSDVDEIKVQALKEYFHGRKLIKRLPKQFLEFESYILSLNYTTDPDYAYLISLLKQAADENGIDLNTPFEWEEEMNDEKDRIINHHITYPFLHINYN
ncbi:MAG: putative Tau-tubulin kinase 1 [Streblomastix strix]|uniref:non-specific serine/threonine protein kinase n=1 Tax=Streblomastix strix TaxID=222440 RepID=A0A5J4WAK5_9EUKA|nr:MAG: putative Tau-tubulin kinase 1 [Streblomastix strix]